MDANNLQVGSLQGQASEKITDVVEEILDDLQEPVFQVQQMEEQQHLELDQGLIGEQENNNQIQEN